MNKDDLIYIYNLEQAYFYIRRNANPLYPPSINPNSKMVFFTFSKQDTNELYTIWLNKIRYEKNKQINLED